MLPCRLFAIAFAIVFAIAAFALPAGAQAVSLWVGAGRPMQRAEPSPGTLHSVDAYGAVQLDLPLLPFALRADASLAGSDLRDGRRDAVASLVFPLRLPFVQPYAMLGYGVYDAGRAGERRGVSAGAGLRLHVKRLGIFGQVRRHEPLGRTIGTVGLTL